MVGRVLTVLGAALGTAAPTALAASQDNNVEWTGISHLQRVDLTPRVPMNGESFTVRFQSFRGDLTSARVVLGDGTAIEAAIDHSRGAYDVWSAQVPATAATTRGYTLELTDGSDTDAYGTNGMVDSGASADDFVIDYATLAHAPLGATPVDGGTVFKVWSPTRTTVHVRGDFNGWSTANPLTKVGDHFIGFVPGAQAGQMYKYFFNNSVWNTDPYARRLNPTDNLNAFIIDPDSYEWQSGPFTPPRFEDMVIYQLHVGSFAGLNDPEGTTSNPSGYRDVGDRAEYLASLGVNAVMLNPIHEFPGDFSGGYNNISIHAVEWRYGTPDDLKYMVDQLHANGIAVILDVVWNHISYSDNFLWNYDGTQLYFDNPIVDTPWGAQADLDADGVRRMYLDSVLLMLDEYRMDGFRMDATDFMNIGSNEAGGWSLMQEMNRLMDSRFIDKINIAEQLPDDPWVTRPTDLGGAGFDAQYYDRFTDDLRDEVFSAAFRGVNMSRLAALLSGGGQYLTGGQVVNYFELHDEAWPLSGGQRAVKTIDTTAPHDDDFARGRTTVAHAFTMLSPGIPAFLMGCEWLESNGFEGERLDWAKRDQNAGVVDFFRAVIELRARDGFDPFDADSGHRTTHLNNGAEVMAFTRDRGGDSYLVVVNLADADRNGYRLGLPEGGAWVELLNNQDPAFQGSGPHNPGTLNAENIAYDAFSQSIELDLAARSILVLAPARLGPCTPDVTTNDTNPGDALFGVPDGEVSVTDLTYFVEAWINGDQTVADLTTNDTNPGGALFGVPDGEVSVTDLTFFVEAWVNGCP
ncbi:MAG: alpha-amylase family glycosyl hydrolase [Planctomycetota bacterium]